MRSFILLLSACLILSNAQAQTSTDPKKNDALVTIGTVSAFALYNTYLAIGAIADAYGSDVYTAQQVGDLMKEQLNMLPVVKDQVNTLMISGYLDAPEDSEYCLKIMNCIDLLLLEAGGLSEYALNGDADAQLNYAHAREDAWDLITELLQIK